MSATIQASLAHGRRAIAQILVGIMITALCVPASAQEYRLAPGDVLRVIVVGVPELSEDVPVEMDGTAWFPLVGSIRAEGLTLTDVRASAADAYATNSLMLPLPTGRALAQFIESEQVHVRVVAYRPIYVSGNVGNPGEIPFRPGLTLRHVMAIAGSTPTEAAGRRVTADELEAAATALAHDYARIWRAKSFLGTATQQDYDRIFVTNNPAIVELLAVERSLLHENRTTLETQRDRLEDEIARIGRRTALLANQLENETAGLKMDEEVLANVRELFSGGLVPASRLAEVRRAALVTASRALEVDVALDNARGQVASREAEIVVLENEARTRAWQELGESVARAQNRRTALAMVAANVTGIAGGNLLGMELVATVFRDGAELDTAEISHLMPLLPGDIVDVRLMPIGGAREEGSG